MLPLINRKSLGYESFVLLLSLGTCCGTATGQEFGDRQFSRERQAGAPRRIVMRLTAEAFASLVDREVDEITPVKDVILDTPVTGKTRTTGKPTVALSDHEKSASFILTLNGVTISRTVGHNGPAIIQSRSETPFTATKRVVFEAGKGFVAEPAQIDTQTRIITEGIGSTRRGLVGRFVQRRASEAVAASRPQAEEIVREKAEHRVSSAFDTFLEGRLARLNRAADVRQAVAYIMRGDGEPRYACCTVDGCIQVVASAGADDEPAASVELPELQQPGAPVQIWLHKSVVGDSPSYVLKQFELMRREPGPVLSTLAAIPAALQAGGKSSDAEEESGKLDYATAGDWIVVQIQIPNEAQQSDKNTARPSVSIERR